MEQAKTILKFAVRVMIALAILNAVSTIVAKFTGFSLAGFIADPLGMFGIKST